MGSGLRVTMRRPFDPDQLGTFTDHRGAPLTYRQVAHLLAHGWRIVIRPTDDTESGGKELHPP